MHNAKNKTKNKLHVDCKEFLVCDQINKLFSIYQK